jgi:hypothetical protein
MTALVINSRAAFQRWFGKMAIKSDCGAHCLKMACISYVSFLYHLVDKDFNRMFVGSTSGRPFHHGPS